MPSNAAANRYELKELLGQGGMGVVYRAFDTRTNSYVALKTLRDTDPASLEMFKREWAELGKVPHANIVDIRDVDEVEENGVRKPCFIMPLLPGCTLAQLIKSSSPRLTTEFVVNVVAQVCKGLQAAHEKDLIHRDLKPSNIFIMEDDTAKIIDFGLVHAIGNKSTTGLKGTWQYMPPEQIDGSKNPNRCFDIYSLGVVAYEALTGYQPFKRADFRDTVDAIHHFVPQAISERNHKVPQLVSKAVHVAMAKQPMHRYASAREFSDTLQKAFHNQYIERFDEAKIRPRIERAKKAFSSNDSEFASEILTELEAEGNLDPDITLLRSQIDEHTKQKKVRQLLEAAQTRMEQEEVPLALDKLEEVLKIDPQNAEALKLRKRIDLQRNQQQKSQWLDLARKHLANHDFSEARRALKEVFNLKYDDPEAAGLKAQVDAREKEVQTAREEKEHLYSYALRHNQNGEVSSALSKLEKLLELSRNVPGASVPERDKVFQSFYNDVRTERDRIDNAYTDGSRHLSEKSFDRALEICDGILTRYPQNPQFLALRLKVEQSSRQQLSAYIAEVTHTAETEPNLDRRVALLEEACRRYPNEAQFSRQLSLTRELRDLVASIVTRARNYEEQGQFTEAIAQWNTLANIHPQYPGIDFEISQLERRREQQVEDDKKSRLVQKIDRALGNKAFADAERLSQEGLLEFPNNPELEALLGFARQGLEKTGEANRLFEEAKQQRSSGDPDQAIALLRQALSLDGDNIVVANTLVNVLVERAHALLATDAAAAEPLAAEAARLDPDHPSVNKVIALIAEAKRKQRVEKTVLEARALQNSDRQQAINILKEGLTVYPGDGRLQQTLSGLQQEERVLGASAFGVAPEEKTFVYAPPTERAPLAPPPPVKPPAPPVSPPPPPAVKPPAAEKPKQAGAPASAVLKARLLDQSRNIIGALLGLAASAVLIGSAYWYLNRKPSAPVPAPVTATPALKSVPVAIQTTPGDATVTVDGRPLSASSLSLAMGSRHAVSVSRPGYQPIANPSIEVTGKPWVFSLAPESLHIGVSVSAPSGAVWLDDQQVGDLQGGSWSSTYPVKTSQERHVLTVKGKKGETVFKIAFTAALGKLALVEPLQTKDLLVASSLGKDAIIYSANRESKLALPGKPRQAIPGEGLTVNLEDATDSNFSIANGKQIQTMPVAGGQAPALSISLNAVPNLVPITIVASAKNAKLFVDRGPIRPKKPGLWSWNVEPGSYKAVLTADGMADQGFVITAKKGASFSRKFDMTPVGPPPASLTITSSTPSALVSFDGSQIGELDKQGNGSFSNLAAGSHKIEIAKSGFGTRTFFSQAFTAGKESRLSNIVLAPLAGYARLTVSPSNASVSYRRSDESEKHSLSDFNKALTLSPGAYDFTADAANYVPLVQSVQIHADQTTTVLLQLRPMSKEAESKVAFVNPNDATTSNGNWYHGVSNNSFVPIQTGYKRNTIFFSKDHRARKLTMKVSLNADNEITYTLGPKGLSVTRLIDDEQENGKSKDVNLDSTSNPDHSYAIVLVLDKGGVNAFTQDGTPIDSTHDDKHDWSHAHIAVKGDTYFTVWLGR